MKSLQSNHYILKLLIGMVGMYVCMSYNNIFIEYIYLYIVKPKCRYKKVILKK